ncbi:hypothetical protein DW2_09111 [Thioclava atlantica]|uniref:FAD-dependent urate hydroxylase HpyO/Asp monooxygenase CreE-like FAD/NAD(P)-binding domain-containing protein n=1 Tax=Thioclava atlantica TaxID=1317124 RepID=A0A085TWM5_9RHOB|nr:hypothetical protein DW2_09111 [Thioclava atlantica]
MALIGGGPTAIYALRHLLDAPFPLDIHVFERDREVGPGMPYREEINTSEMLSNIGSREIPPVLQTLVEFLSDCDTQTLSEFGLSEEEIGPETFFPRLVLGRYFTAQLAALVARARRLGHRVEVRSRYTVRDIVPGPEGTEVSWQSPSGDGTARYDHVVVATGHQWADRVHSSGVTLHAPWPAKALRRFIGCKVGILGSSLTAIDTVLALAVFHGTFVEDGEDVRWDPAPSAEAFRAVMMSRRGLLPDADWYYELPLPGLPSFDEDAVSREIARGPKNLLARCHRILASDIAALDPDYAQRTSPEKLDGFADRHFAERMKGDPWEVARSLVEIASVQREARTADPWRPALLKAHEIYERIIPHLSAQEREIFSRELKPVFADIYASVPHRSIRRMLALHEAGVLELTRLGSDYTINPRGAGVLVEGASGALFVDALIDARGQRAADLSGLKFPTLAAMGEFDPSTLSIRVPEGCRGTITCVAIPVLLPSNPFVQGLERARDLGRLAAERIIGEERDAVS